MAANFVTSHGSRLTFAGGRDAPTPRGEDPRCRKRKNTESPEQLFAVATFDRVFDNTPLRDVITIEELLARAAALHRQAQDPPDPRKGREENRGGLAGLPRRQGRRLDRRLAPEAAAAQAEAKGEDPRKAAEEHYQHLLFDARAAPKRDLRLWSPALYKEGTTRGGENVIHLSLPGARLRREQHLGRGERHLAGLLPPGALDLFLHPGEAEVPADPAARRAGAAGRLAAKSTNGPRKGPASRSTRPARASARPSPCPRCPTPPSPRIAWTRPGPLLDPVLEGLIAESRRSRRPGCAPPSPTTSGSPIAGKEVVEGSWPPDAGVDLRAAGRRRRKSRRADHRRGLDQSLPLGPGAGEEAALSQVHEAGAAVAARWASSSVRGFSSAARPT